MEEKEKRENKKRKKKGWKKRNMYVTERKESQKHLTEGGEN